MAAPPQGFTHEVKLYTQAISACMVPGAYSWEGALKLYYAMQRAGVKPDKKFFACLVAVAGRTGQLEAVFELVQDMAGEGMAPSSSTASAMVYACLEQVRGCAPSYSYS